MIYAFNTAYICSGVNSIKKLDVYFLAIAECAVVDESWKLVTGKLFGKNFAEFKFSVNL